MGFETNYDQISTRDMLDPERVENEDGVLPPEKGQTPGVGENSNAESFDNRTIWDPDKIDSQKLLEDFKDVNRSVSDLECPFWVLLFIVYFAFFCFATISLDSVFDSSNIKDLTNLTPQMLAFWIILIQKVGFIALILSLGIPLVNLFTKIIVSMMESKERQTVRFVSMVKFIHVLKYKGSIHEEKLSYYSDLNNSTKNTSSALDEFASFLNVFEKSDFFKLVKKVIGMIKD